MASSPQLHSVGGAEKKSAPLSLEERLAAIEEKIVRFENAMIGAARMMLDNPMASAMMPKKMKEDLRAFLTERDKNESNAVTP